MQLTFSPSSKPPKARARDPLTAESTHEFHELTQKKYGRPATAKEVNAFWDTKPEIFQMENQEPLYIAKRRIKA